jgi:hypothetical protein
LHHVPGAVEVGVDDGVPAFDRKVDCGLRKLPAGAVDEDVETTVVCPDLLEQGIDRVGLADVGGISGGFQISRGQLSGERVELCLVASDQDDMGAEAREQPGNGAAAA